MINLSPGDRKRFHDLFQKIDSDKDGKIDVDDLVNLYEKLKLSGDLPPTSPESTSNSTNSLSRAKVDPLFNFF
jgi:Ca2+-binding EF-hand superfamily protein